MYHSISVQSVPEIREVSTMTRKTVWTCADERNIIVCVLEGSCVFIIEKTKYLLKKGQVLLIPAGQPYIRTPYDDTECTFIYIHFQTQKPIMRATQQVIKEYFNTLNTYNEMRLTAPTRQIKKPDDVIFMTQIVEIDQEDQHNIYSLLEDIDKNFKKTEPYRMLYVEARFVELLTYLGRESVSKLHSALFKTAIQFPVQIQKAIFYIHENYDKKISVEELCRICSVSSQHMVRLFRKHLGVTPVQYINRSKIASAIEMLRSTNLSVNEIAFELGFDDPNYFRRLFKKEKKTSPSDYRTYMNKFVEENDKRHV